jgi:hypothetical protein
MTSFYFHAISERAARSYIAKTREPNECIATFRTATDGEYRGVLIDLDHVETLPDTDAIEAYAAGFANPGEELVGVN